MFADNVKRLRDVKGLTQNGLAKKASIPQNTLHYIESGRVPRADVAYKIAQVLDTTVEELLGNSNEQAASKVS